MFLLEPFYRVRRRYLDRVTNYHIISYPKSGRTWTRYFLSKYFHKAYNIPEHLGFKTLIKRHQEIPRFDFNHSFFHDENLDALNAYINSVSDETVILIARDPRDVVVSFYHHAQNRQIMLDSRGMTMSEFIRHPQLGVERIVTYMNAWVEGSDAFKQFHIVRYEDLNSDSGLDCFRNIVKLLQSGRVDEESLVFAYTESQFDRMQQKEKNSEMSNKILQATDTENVNSFKARKGKVGSYKEELSAEDIDYCNEFISKLNPQFEYDV